MWENSNEYMEKKGSRKKEGEEHKGGVKFHEEEERGLLVLSLTTNHPKVGI